MIGDRYTDFLRVDSLFWAGGGWGGGGLSVFFKDWIEVPDFLCIAASVCYEKNFTLIMQKSRVYTPLFHSNYFQKESTLFEKTRPIFVNTALYPRKELTLWVDLQKCRFGRNYRDFSPNYFDYRLWSSTWSPRLCLVDQPRPVPSIRRLRSHPFPASVHRNIFFVFSFFCVTSHWD
jgi:hypothetical protein